MNTPMRLAQDGERVHPLAPDRPDQPFGKAILPRRSCCSRLVAPDLLDLEIFGRFLAAVRNEFEVDLLALIQSTESRTFHCRDVNEHVFAAAA